MFVTATEWRDHIEEEGARIYDWMLRENGVHPRTRLRSHSAMGDNHGD